MSADLKIKDFEYIVAVAEEGSFTRAAQRLFIAQPALSRRIHEIEQLLGVDLFKRTTRSLTLTDSGETLLRHARTILAEYDGLQEDLRRKEEHLVVGYHPILGQPPYLVETIRRMGVRHPGVALKFVCAFPPDMMAGLKNHGIDCALLFEGYVCNAAELQYESLYPIEAMLVVAPGHPLAGRKRVAFAELSGMDLAILSKECTPLLNSNTLCSLRAAGARPGSVMTTDNLDELLLTVRAGKTAAFVSSDTCVDEDLIALPLTGEIRPPEHRNRVLAWHVDNANPCITSFLTTLKESISRGFIRDSI